MAAGRQSATVKRQPSLAAVAPGFQPGVSVAGLEAFASFPAGRQDAAGYGRQGMPAATSLALVAGRLVRERIYEMECLALRQ
jgi:hypothetical protein